MLIYKGPLSDFISEVRENRLSEILQESFRRRFGWLPSHSEIVSWQNSLPKVRDLLEIAGLSDNMIAIEYEIPYNQKRIDCLLFGRGDDGASNIVLIELKQWSSVSAREDQGNFVETYTGGMTRVVAHPSEQTKGYHNYLKGFVQEFENEPPLILFSCAYCHNYSKSAEDGLFDPIYHQLIKDFPLYAQSDTRELAGKIKLLLAKGDGFEIFNRFMTSRIHPTKKLLENVSKVIRNEPVFSLINEQLVAKNIIWSKVKKASKEKEYAVIIVHGGPGTGKSLIALNILADAARLNMKAFYGCKSKPFTSALQSLIGRESQILISNLYRFTPSKVKSVEVDLLLVDEAHRIEKNSNHQFTKAADRSEMPQVDQLMVCSKVAVFFIDDRQNVRSREIGHSDMIRDAAKRHNRNVYEVALQTQFRCMGSNDYLLWLESVLGYGDEKRVLRKGDVFDFRIFDSPQSLYNTIAEKENEKENSARLVAGFCWPWSKGLDEYGQLVKDVRIGDFAMPWETHGDIKCPPTGYVPWYQWGYRKEGIKQVGCIYTAQGFEFDYIGVIVGDDLVYDPETDSLTADISATQDRTLKQGAATFEKHVKNIYRTLMSRGMRGCYVYFTNKSVEAYFRNRIEQQES